LHYIGRAENPHTLPVNKVFLIFNGVTFVN
jgi:hypothetical protein